MSMGFTPINKPRVTPPILQRLEANDADTPANSLYVNRLWDEHESSTPPGKTAADQLRSGQSVFPASRPAQPLVQTLPTRPASNETRPNHFMPSQPTFNDESPTQILSTRNIANESPRTQPQATQAASTQTTFDRGKLRPSSDVHPMTDWLRELPEEVKLRMNLGKGPNGEAAFSFREWEHQKLSSVSPFVLDKLRDAIRRDALDTGTGKRRPNSDIRDLLVEWDCNFDDYEDIDSWEKKHNMPVVFAWLCVRKMRVAINNKKAMWLKDLFPDEQSPELSNGSEKRARPVSLLGPPPKDLDMKRMKLENQVPSAISTGFTSISSMPTPPNDAESLTTDRRAPEFPPK
jgi:hypothetical protein